MLHKLNLLLLQLLILLHKNANNVSKEKSPGLIKKIGKSIGNVIKSFGPMLLITAVIAAITWAVTKLVEKMNEVPESLTVKLQLMDEVTKPLESAWTKVKEIQKDLMFIDRLQGKAYANKLKFIKDIMVKEGIATANEIKDLNAKELRESEYFKRYLKNVENNAYDAALIKMKAERRAELDIAKMKEEIILEEVKIKLIANGKTQKYADEAAEYFKKGEMNWLVTAGNGLSGYAKEWNKVVDTVKLANKELKTLNKLEYKGDFSLTDTKGGAGGSSTTYSPEAIDKSPEVIIAKKVAEKVIEWEQWKLTQLSYLEQEQMDISEERIKKTPLFGDNVFKQLEYDIRLNSAALKDNKDAQKEAYDAMNGGEADKKEFIKTHKDYIELQLDGNKLLKDETYLQNILNEEIEKIK